MTTLESTERAIEVHDRDFAEPRESRQRATFDDLSADEQDKVLDAVLILMGREIVRDILRRPRGPVALLNQLEADLRDEIETAMG